MLDSGVPKRKTRHISFIIIGSESHPPSYPVGKCTGKGHPRTVHQDPEGEQMYSSTLPSTSALDGGGWSTTRPGRFIPGKENRYPLRRRLREPQGRSGQVRKISPPLGFDPRTVQPVASRYTYWAISAPVSSGYRGLSVRI
jgi:hypothetical protein